MQAIYDTNVSILSDWQRAGGRRWRALPGLLRIAFSLNWRASPTRMTVALLLLLVEATGAAGVVLGGQSAVASVLEADLQNRSLGSILGSLVPVAVAAAVMRLASAVRRVNDQHLQLLVGRESEAQVLNTASSVDLAAFEDQSFFNLVQRATRGLMYLPQQCRFVVSLLGNALTVVAVAGALVALHPLLLGALVVACVPTLVTSLRSARMDFELNIAMMLNTRQRGYLSGLMTGRDEAKEVRAFSLAPALLARWHRLYDDYTDRQLIVLRKAQIRGLVGVAMTAAMVGIVSAYVLWMVLEGSIGLAAGTAALYAIRQLRAQIESAMAMMTNIYTGGLYLADFEHFRSLARPPSAPPADVPPFAELRVENVTFRYPGSETNAIDDVSLTLQAGEVIALVGENGSGKTTLAKLLCQLYRPSAGRVLWDRTDVSDLDADSLRDSIAVIFQDFVRYELPARDNIALGRHTRADDHDAIVAAAAVTGADAMLSALPHGYDTVLSKSLADGVDLSIGQWQRVALARAVFRDAPFIVLDEPTAALDPRAEHELFANIRELCKGRAVLLISHRFSTVRSADRIYVLHNGRIIEHGTHAHLMASAGTYAELFTLQASAYQDSATSA